MSVNNGECRLIAVIEVVAVNDVALVEVLEGEIEAHVDTCDDIFVP